TDTTIIQSLTAHVLSAISTESSRTTITISTSSEALSQLNSPAITFVDISNNIYIADTGNDRIVKHMTTGLVCDETDGYFRTIVDLDDGFYHYQFRVVTKSWFHTEPLPPLLLPDYDTDEQYSTMNEYEWKYDNCHLPLDEELVIYELHVGDFSGGENDRYTHTRGQFKNVIEKALYLKTLGINAIELMPVQEHPSNYCRSEKNTTWGYNPRYLFAIESSYGTTYQMKEMIDEMHKNGIRVILDGVYNHSDCSSPLTQIDHDYWYHHNPKDRNFSWGPEWNYSFYDQKYKIWPARNFVCDSVRYLIEEFHIDGIRFDAARQIQHFDFLRWMTQEAKKTSAALGFQKIFYTIAEFLPDEPCITNVDGPMDGCWHDSFYWCLRDCLLYDNIDIERLKNVIDCRRQGFMGVTNVVNYSGENE
ncbi:unnamed protein product, partial [Didymodactylos carnosus]